MALGGLVGCASCLAASAFVATGGRTGDHVAGWEARRAYRAVSEACATLGDSALVDLLLRLASWRALADGVARRLRAGHVAATRETACALVVAGVAVVAVLAGLFARSLIGLVAGVALCCVGIEVWHSSRERARRRALVDEMPQVFRTLALALGSGETLTQAIEYVGVHESGYAGQAFVQAALRLRCGASTEEAMAQLTRDLDAPGIGLLATALVIAQRTGSPLRGLFQSSAQLVERQGEYERMLAVKTAQVRLSVRIVCLLPVLLVCVLSLISVDFQQGLATVPGTACLLVATAMDGAALAIIRHLMRGVL
ncbi:MAG: type II secretion system F family protein [Atopobiaceae bacterium]|nr:type II secretion system F family protein [Atopobiaceae bacterium]